VWNNHEGIKQIHWIKKARMLQRAKSFIPEAFNPLSLQAMTTKKAVQIEAAIAMTDCFVFITLGPVPLWRQFLKAFY